MYRLDKPPPEPKRVLLVYGVGWLAKYRLVRKVELAPQPEASPENTSKIVAKPP